MNHKLRATAGAVAITMTMLTSLTACGGDTGKDADSKKKDGFADQSVEEIQKQVQADMAELKSVRIAGDVQQNGQALSLDLALNTDKSCAGSITIQGGTAEIISGPDGQFLKGDNAFWAVAAGGEAAAEQVTNLLGDRWAKMPESQAGLGDICDLDSLLSDSADVKADSEIGDQVTIDGADALELISTDTEPQTVSVALDEPHYILKVTKDGTEGGTITLSDFDVEVDAAAPDKADYLDFDKLGS
ncbi:MAG: hypothetical protein ACRCYU_08640 [Nocardioides sp.]